MKNFWQTLKTVPSPAWIFGVLVTLLLVPAMLFGPLREQRTWSVAAKIAMATFPALVIVAYSALVGFIYADAKRRRMRHVMWAWLALVPYFVGVILYFIMRSPLPMKCPQCHADVPKDFAFCPCCGTSVHPICSQCGKMLECSWVNCPHCGARVAPPTAA